jgi:hypothetical protein
MTRFFRYLLVASLALLTITAYAELNLNNNKNLMGEDPQLVFNENFSYENAVNSISKVREYLKNYLALMEKYNDYSIRNSGGYIGFFNIPSFLEGAIHKQNYLLKKTEYELAQYKYKAGEITAADVATAKTAFETAEKDFQKFWDGFRIED